MTELSMYWLTRLDQVRSFFGGIQALTVIVGVIGFVVLCILFVVRGVNERYNGPGEYVDSDYNTADRAIKVLRWPFASCVLTALACSLALMFVPTTKEMAAIKVIPAITTPENCEKLKKISKDFLDVAVEWLKDEKKKEQE